MEGLTSIVLGAVGLWGLYWVVRSGVKGGLLDAAREWDHRAARDADAAAQAPDTAGQDARAHAPRPSFDTLA